MRICDTTDGALIRAALVGGSVPYVGIAGLVCTWRQDITQGVSDRICEVGKCTGEQTAWLYPRLLLQLGLDRNEVAEQLRTTRR